MTRPRPVATLAAGVAVFVAVLVLLAWQVRSGRDPALGAAKTARVAPAPRRVLVKKVVRRVIVTKVVQTDDGPVLVASTAPAPAASSGTTVQSAPAVVYSAPAPAPAPAAPVVTKTS